jgi:hypothetical protein
MIRRNLGSPCPEFAEMILQPTESLPQHTSWQLDESVKNPQNQQRERKRQNQRPDQCVPKAAARREAEKILKIWCEGADH